MVKVLLRFLSNDARYDPHGFTSALEALEKMKTEPFDLVITDIQMHEISGLKLIPKIQALNPDCDIVVITGIEEEEVFKKALDLGAYACLLKPFKKDQLLEVLETLRHRRAKGSDDRKAED